jgi:hypothetical protein
MFSLLSDRPTVIERAYELARNGSCASFIEIKKQLRKEGYPIRELAAAPSLTRTLGKLCAGRPDAQPAADRTIRKRVQ